MMTTGFRLTTMERVKRHTRRVLSVALLICILVLFFVLINKQFDYNEERNVLNVQSRYKRKATRAKCAPKRASRETVCRTRACKKLGRELKRMLDPEADPCHDFYQFVCGNYAKNARIDDDMVSTGVLEKADQRVQTDLRQQLMARQKKKSASKSVKYAANMFTACMDKKSLEKRGIKPLLAILADIGGWPLISNFKAKKYDRWEALAKMNAIYAESAVFDLSVGQDLKSNRKNIIYFGPTSSLLTHRSFMRRNRTNSRPFPKTPPIMPKKKQKEDNATKDAEEAELLLNHILETVLLLGGQDTEETRQQIIEVVLFSNQLEEMSGDEEDLESLYNKMTFEDLNSLTDNRINWIRFTNRVFALSGSKRQFTKQDNLVVTDPVYFAQLPELMANTSDTLIANYLGFVLVNDFGQYTVDKFRDLDFRLTSAVVGTRKPSPLWKVCLELVRSTMSFAISRDYVKKRRLFHQLNKSMVSELVDYIQQSFHELLERNTVLDKQTRRRSLKKLSLFRKNVGYPLWLFNQTVLDQMYSLERKCDKRKLMECILHLLKRLVFKIFDQIDKPVDKETNWPMDPTTVNAAYLPSDNSITIPSSLINALFSADMPREVNYARLGLIVGHEMTHGFDPEGSLFDEQGNMASIWSEQTQSRFEERQQCFVNQYNKYCDQGFCIDGNLTASENIADNGGMREVFRAYKLCTNSKSTTAQRLPHVSQYTSDQLFFMAFASLWCDNTRPEAFEAVYADDEHSPPKYRVNGVVANFMSFANAFRCPVDSQMNPSHKCVLF